MENFRVGVLDRLGFSVARLHELNPRLVVLSITGFGHDGPEAKRAGYDQIAQGEGGLMSLTGTEQPTKVGVPDRGPAGRHERRVRRARRAARARPRPASAGSCGPRCSPGWSASTPSRAPGGRSGARCPGLAGSHHPAIAPYGLFETGTAPIQIACGSEDLWRALCTAPRPRPGRPAVRQQPAAGRSTATSWSRCSRAHFATDPAEHWLELLSGAGVPSGKVRTLDDVYAWEQTLSQHLLLTVEHADAG